MRRGISNKFNRGEVDIRAMSREDVDKVNASAELVENFMPERLGPMQYRPGTRYLGTLTEPVRLENFIAASDDVALLEFTADDLRVWVDDQLITRPASTMTIVNGDFATDLSGWTDASGAGSTVTWGDGAARLLGAEETSAKLWQTLGGSVSKTGIRIKVTGSSLLFQIGTTGVDSNDIFSGTLTSGEHSFVYTPGLLPTITISNANDITCLVDEVTIEPAGIMSVPHATITDLSSLRVTQSADVLYCATSNTRQFMVERRGTESWSIVSYQSLDGPFGKINPTEITLQVADLNGDTTLTASVAIFLPDDVGDLFKLSSGQQAVDAVVTGDNSGTNSIRVTGVGATRQFQITVDGSFNGTITLQRSEDDTIWLDVEDYTSALSKPYNDNLDNQVQFYRLFVKTGDYSSGTINLSLVYLAGSIDGICQVIGYQSGTVVDVQVLQDFGATFATRDWYRGEWQQGSFPTAVALYEGRLWWAGKTKIWGSVSDDYQSFFTGDDVEEADAAGDAAPIRRTIGFGPVDTVYWLNYSSRLVIGIASDAISLRSSSFSEILTNTNANLKSGSTQGAANVDAIKVDSRLIYVQRSGTKLMEAAYDSSADTEGTTDLMTLHQRVAEPGIERISIARQPESRVYVMLSDGELRVYLNDPAEDVAAWSRITFDGQAEDIIVQPTFGEDIVYVVINRGGARTLTRMADLGEYVQEHFDQAINETAPGTTMAGLDHLEGETVGVWGNAQDHGDQVVSGGQVTVPAGLAVGTVGLRYTAKYRSAKVSRYIKGASLGRRKRVIDLHLELLDTWPGSITLGPSFSLLEDMPLIEAGAPVDQTTMIDDYTELPFEFNGEEEIDPRIHIQATGPCTIIAFTYGVVHHGDQGGPLE